MSAPLYVISTSAGNAERHAALYPDVWFASADDARTWLARCEPETAELFKVYEVTRIATHDGWIWKDRELAAPVECFT